MAGDESRQVWLVERSYGNDEDLVTLVYATVDGERHHRKQLSHALLRRTEITAGKEVPVSKLEPVMEAETKDRFAMEASKLAETHDPDESI